MPNEIVRPITGQLISVLLAIWCYLVLFGVIWCYYYYCVNCKLHVEQTFSTMELAYKFIKLTYYVFI